MCLRHYFFDRTFVDTLIGINPTYYVPTHSEDLKLGFNSRLWSMPMTLPLSEWAIVTMPFCIGWENNQS